MDKTPTVDKQKELHDRRYGAEAYCKNCIHAWEFRPDPMALSTILVCRGAPPNFQFVPVATDDKGQVQMAAREVLRAVGPDYFCGSFTRDSKSLS